MSLSQILDLFEPLHIESWYVLAAFLLALVLQIAKQTPAAKTVWTWLPKQWRWVWSALAGFATGFVLGYQQGLPVIGAVLSGIGGAFGVGMLSGGLNDWLEKSVLPWPGSPRPEPIPNHLSGPEPSEAKPKAAAEAELPAKLGD